MTQANKSFVNVDAILDHHIEGLQEIRTQEIQRQSRLQSESKTVQIEAPEFSPDKIVERLQKTIIHEPPPETSRVLVTTREIGIAGEAKKMLFAQSLEYNVEVFAKTIEELEEVFKFAYIANGRKKRLKVSEVHDRVFRTAQESQTWRIKGNVRVSLNKSNKKKSKPQVANIVIEVRFA